MRKDIESMNDKTRVIHNVNTGRTFSKIQDAVDDEETIEGHIILVYPGTYEENVKVNKKLTIESTAGPGDTTVKARDAMDHVFEVVANGVTIKGFTVYGATAKEAVNSDRRSGIYLHYASHCTISNNYCGYDRDHKNVCGIYLTDKSTNNTIAGNICNENDRYGIVVMDSKNIIAGNTCNENHCYGIAVRGSKNIITGNTSSGHQYACISVGGLGNIVTDNTCSEAHYCGVSVGGLGNIVTDNTFNGGGHTGISVGNLNSISVGNTSNGQSEGNNLREGDNIIIVGMKYDPLEVKKNFPRTSSIYP